MGISIKILRRLVVKRSCKAVMRGSREEFKEAHLRAGVPEAVWLYCKHGEPYL